ncbi:MAG: hypothetical protein ABIT08_02985 [Bacteroidia bacterium]
MDYPFSGTSTKVSKRVQFINKILRRLKFDYELKPAPRVGKDFITAEQVVNLYHLLSGILFYKVEGAIVELGAHIGQSAIIIQSIIENMNSQKPFIVYDKFDLKVNGIADKEIFIDNFKASGYRIPEMKQGLMEQIVPGELPLKIAFAHIDLGTGFKEGHQKLIDHCLKSIYPRLSPGGVCMLMDYHDNMVTQKGLDENPGIKKACDNFFRDKAEKVFVLYGNQYSHGFFRKNIDEAISLSPVNLTKKRTDEFIVSKQRLSPLRED